MSRNCLCFAVLVALILTECVVGAGPQQPPPWPLPKSTLVKPVVQLVAELDAPRFAVREAAMRALMRMGKPAVKPLAKAAEGDSLEVTVRAIAILQYIYSSVAEDAVESAELALEDLAESENRSIASRANSVLQANVAVRRKRAIGKIQELGGIFLNKSSVYDPNDRIILGKSLSALQLGLSWKGGDQGLRYVKRLANLTRIIFIERTNDISNEALQALTGALPNLTIVHRGPAFLGVKAFESVFGSPCQIVTVQEGSAAFKAKMKSGDVVVSFDDKPVSDFDALVDLVRDKNPGDTVSVKVVREGKSVILQVTLDSWKAQSDARSSRKSDNKPNPSKR